MKRFLPDIAVGVTVLALCGLLAGAWLGPASWPARGHSVVPAAVTAPGATR